MNKLIQLTHIQDFRCNNFGTIAVSSSGIVVVLHQQGFLLLTMQLLMLLQKGHEVESTWFCIDISLKFKFYVFTKSLQSFLSHLKHHNQLMNTTEAQRKIKSCPFDFCVSVF